MKNTVLFLILILLGTNCAYSYKIKEFTPFENDISYNQVGSDYPKITLIESNLFNMIYEHENIYKRLNRIEKKIFKKTFPNSPLSNRVENIILHIDKKGADINISKSDLTQLEKEYFGQAFKDDTIENRIIRIEQQVFGTIQSGSINNRFNALLNAYTQTKYKNNNNYNTLNQEYWQNTYPNQVGNLNSTNRFSNTFKNVMSNMFMGGCVTGFTPPIYNSSTNYYNPYAFNPCRKYRRSNCHNPYNQYNPYINNVHGRGYNYNGIKNFGSNAGARVFY